MKRLVFGSLNIDRTYTVEHFAAPGETICAERMELFCGGKGFNQAVAMARAGSQVCFAGAVGADGVFLLKALSEENIDISRVMRSQGYTGHAVIQVDSRGGNCILILPGANGDISREYIDRVLEDFSAEDVLLVQNEISNLPYLLSQAHRKGMVVALNPSPYNKALDECDLSMVDFLCVNEVEGAAITGEKDYLHILRSIHSRYPETKVLLTLGHSGSVFMDEYGQIECCGIYSMTAVDSTAAGDTYTGYMLSLLLSGSSISEAMSMAAIASGIAVSRPGASASIPFISEVEAADRSRLMPFAL